jgi:hypothetical protein
VVALVIEFVRQPGYRNLLSAPKTIRSGRETVAPGPEGPSRIDIGSVVCFPFDFYRCYTASDLLYPKRESTGWSLERKANS